ncbi:BZ3500_MvSof-1268-A1-R1_Chr7-1g09427 [Microbotryum saponariae]|uniref:BZ3500_MvSof-1268-A1-R1_Chr7-1g09427 protein n=1 Tax=Microbotryum saponariae TaxID=289078 RepID=A0A2X0L9A0_9BASI|nr:BZ3501_MvSof-1269-A2-R1_Chr7-1g09132 [Microbotryum saponariae]SDA03421.1 BZ3500_MvSof-1268-A1-R1_Chr7-1g09427 [Microbotryum saponariae]
MALTTVPSFSSSCSSSTDFEFSSPFDFDFFPSTSTSTSGLDSHTTLPTQHPHLASGSHHGESSSAASMLGVSGLSSHSNAPFNSNPFSPQYLASPPSHFSSFTSPSSSAAPSTSSNALFTTPSSSSTVPAHRPFLPSPPPPQDPSTSLSAAHPSTSLNPSPLFDDFESALLSSFLTTLDVDPFFLFNSVLPPGMPSPPPRFPLDEGAKKERDRLGYGLGSIKLENREKQGEGTTSRDGGVDTGDGEGEGEGDDQGDDQGEEDGEEEEEEGTPTDRARSSDVVVGRGGKRARGTGQRRRGGLAKGKKARRVSVNESEAQDVEMVEAVSMTSSTGRGARAVRSTKGSGEMGSASRRLSSVARSKDAGRSITPLEAPSGVRQDERQATEEATMEGADDPPPPPQEVEEDDELEDEEDNNVDDDDDDSKANKAPLTDTQKRSNHIASEQKRRNAIRSGFKDLVDLLAAGEAASGIVVAPPEVEAANDVSNGGKKKRASKGTGRGRGRKGEVAAGGSKSVVLEKVAAYILWLERGNQALTAEVKRIEVNMRQMGIETV